jgi:hypothetical protein
MTVGVMVSTAAVGEVVASGEAVVDGDGCGAAVAV